MRDTVRTADGENIIKQRNTKASCHIWLLVADDFQLVGNSEDVNQLAAQHFRANGNPGVVRVVKKFQDWNCVDLPVGAQRTNKAP